MSSLWNLFVLMDVAMSLTWINTTTLPYPMSRHSGAAASSNENFTSSYIFSSNGTQAKNTIVYRYDGEIYKMINTGVILMNPIYSTNTKDVIYVTDGDSEKFNILGFSSASVKFEYNISVNLTTETRCSCLSSNETHLILSTVTLSEILPPPFFNLSIAVYEIALDKWAQHNPSSILWTVGDQHHCEYFNHTFYIFGCITTNPEQPSCEYTVAKYNDISKNWKCTLLYAKFRQFDDISASVIMPQNDGKIYFIGTCNETGFGCGNYNYVFNANNDEVSYLGILPQQQWGSMVSFMQNRIYLFGGYQDSNNYNIKINTVLMSSAIPTFHPTKSPTKSPSKSPTRPTAAPTRL
eukprot:335620_1